MKKILCYIVSRKMSFECGYLYINERRHSIETDYKDLGDMKCNVWMANLVKELFL